MIDLTREQDKKALADANEAVRVARDRLDKVRSGGIFGGVNERRVIEKTETLRITTIRQEEAVSTRKFNLILIFKLRLPLPPFYKILFLSQKVFAQTEISAPKLFFLNQFNTALLKFLK